MTFKVAITDVSICNEALALLPADPITAMSEQSLEARECRRFYPHVVAEKLEEHHWDMATQRAAMAVKVNDRPEWQFAYAKPDDMAYPASVFGDGGRISVFGIDRTFMWNGYRAFQIVGNTIYSNIRAAMMEYTSFNITEADFTFAFKKAVTYDLAARLCMPIEKSMQRAQMLQQAAEGYLQRAKADDLNRNHPTYGEGLTESQVVRFGLPAMPVGFAIDPVQMNTGY